ncbi:hypothetical protein KIW84_044792 [Lathyrus oleraceus]|uniref:Uncharacterized protein n=1 Tax=Pisum sativum TaxID=3888 RepID=A0A9D4XIL6_PEA|nr:hypothetical protein KIW84_044792 [Pisum sativum]
MKQKIVHAWHNVHRKGRSELGPCNCVAFEAYTLWVKKRALELKMPYPSERPMSMVVADPLTLPNQDVEELEDALIKMKQEKDMWEERFHDLSKKHEEFLLEPKDKDALIELLEDRVTKRHREPEVSASSMPQPSVAWKKIVDRLVLEKTQMKASFETEIRRIRRKYAPLARSSDTVVSDQCFCALAKLTHRYKTRANDSKIMEHLEQENRDLKEEIARLTAMGAPGHDIEKCYPLKYEVKKLMKSGMVSFEDCAPNVKVNPLPAHGNASVNMVEGCPGEYKLFDVRFIRESLVQIHKDICMVSECEHDHEGCDICSINPRGCVVEKRDIQRLMDEGMIQICQSRHEDEDVNIIVPIFRQPEWLVMRYDNNKNVSNRSVSPLVIRLAGPVPYASDKVVPYQCNAMMIEKGQEVPLPMTSSVVSIADVMKVTRSGRVFGLVVPESKEKLIVGKKAEVPMVDLVGCSRDKFGEPSNLKANSNDDEVLRLIKRSEFNVLSSCSKPPLRFP